MAPHRLDDTGAQLAAELVDHAGDPGPAGVIGVRGDSLVDLAGGEHLPWPTGQQEQNIKLHRRQVHHLAGLQDQPALRVDLQRAKEQRRFCGGGHRGQVCDRSKGRHSIRKDSVLAIVEGKDYKLPMWITSNRIERRSKLYGAYFSNVIGIISFREANWPLRPAFLFILYLKTSLSLKKSSSI